MIAYRDGRDIKEIKPVLVSQGGPTKRVIISTNTNSTAADWAAAVEREFQPPVKAEIMLRNSLGKLKVTKDQDKFTLDDLRQRNKLKKCGPLRWDVYAFMPLGTLTIFNCNHTIKHDFILTYLQ